MIRRVEGPPDAETIVFVHGAGVAGWMWDKQVQALGRYRKIVVDLPDHGKDRARPFTRIEAAADELAAVVTEQCTGGRAHLVGHSLGAKIVLECLARHPERASSAVVSSALVRPSALAGMLKSRALNVVSLWMLRSAWVARMQANQFAFPDPAMTEAFLADLAATRVENLERPIAAFCDRLFLPPGLARATCPVLVTAGAEELASMRLSAEDIVAALPDARLEVLPNADHGYPWNKHEVYTGMLERWLGGDRA